MIEFETIDIKPLEEYMKRINRYFDKLKKLVVVEIQNDLEYEIYYFACASSDITRTYTRNLYRVNKEQDKRFLLERKNFKSDLATIKKIKKDMISEYTEIELQEQVIDWINWRKKDIHRLADHLNWVRIWDLAMAKRQPKM